MSTGASDSAAMAEPTDSDRTRTLRFALLLTFSNGFIDAYTYIVRGGVFANVQTGNVFFFALNLSERRLSAAFSHVFPMVAFIIGIFVAAHVKSGRTDRHVSYPLRWTMAIQVLALVVIGCVPVSVPHGYVTIPIALLAGVQVGFFRNVGDLAYLPVATTGNLMRFVEATYAGFVEKTRSGRRAAGVYGSLIVVWLPSPPHRPGLVGRRELPTSTTCPWPADPTTAWSHPAAGAPPSPTAPSNGPPPPHLDTGQPRTNTYHHPERHLRPPDGPAPPDT